LGRASRDFIDFLVEAGQSWWQMLPIGPPGTGSSPYNALSVFAGNTALLSLEVLADAGLLSRADLRGAPPASETAADFPAVQRFREPRLRRAFVAFERDAGTRERRALTAFALRERAWLPDYALFRALKRANRGVAWTGWPAELRDRRRAALARARRMLAGDIRYVAFLQHQFHEQWSALRRRCDEAGIALLGDVPIYIAHDSADVWAHRGLFDLDREGRPQRLAGVPPDYFSRHGQLWNNPLYRWERHRRTGFRWWIERLRSAFRYFDALRLDHFIGFQRYWAVPAKERTALRGTWRPGPGDALFHAAFRALGPLELVAEDLGCVTPEVVALRDRLGLPGIRVLQFAFEGEGGASPYLPHNFPRRCVVYPGTHDNDTIVGWFRSGATRRERAAALAYLGTSGRELHWDVLRLALASVADLAIAPAQDLLGLGSAARMNRPGTSRGNWRWRLAPGALDARIARRLRALTERYGRLPAGAAHGGNDC
jgi:4-alpha-glucanotransferase